MNLYTYVGGDPVNAIDPWGLATYEGPGAFMGGGSIAGGLLFNADLSTKCCDGKMQTGKLTVIFLGADIGLSPIQITASWFKFIDNASGRGDLNNLRGLSSVNSVGFATPFGGYSSFDMQVGRARSVGTGYQAGFDLGYVGMVGWATIEVDEICCGY